VPKYEIFVPVVLLNRSKEGKEFNEATHFLTKRVTIESGMDRLLRPGYKYPTAFASSVLFDLEFLSGWYDAERDHVFLYAAPQTIESKVWKTEADSIRKNGWREGAWTTQAIVLA
jgi:hypothetical protein